MLQSTVQRLACHLQVSIEKVVTVWAGSWYHLVLEVLSKAQKPSVS